MNKTQRARLIILSGIAAATLSAAEQTELTDLRALAILHPDASKDVEAPAAAAPATAAVPTASATSAPAAAPAPAAPAAASISPARAAIAAAVASIQRAPAVAAVTGLAEANTRIALITGERDTARTDLAAARAEVASLQGFVANRDAFAAFFGLTAADFTGKTAADMTKLFSAKVSAIALEEMAALGNPTGRLPKHSESLSGAAAGTLEELEAQMNAEKDPDKRGTLAKAYIALRDGTKPGNN